MAEIEPDRALDRVLHAQAARKQPLTVEEERALFARLPDAEASRDLVEHNLDLVVGQAERHQDRGLSFADLYQEGTVGLLDAVGAYTGQGTFRDFASLHIGLQMDSLIEAEAGAIREADRYVADSRSLDLAQVMFRQQHHREPDQEELAALLNWDRAHLAKVMAMLEAARERNDLLTLEFLDDAGDEVPGTDYPEPDKDPHRQLRGHGPDD
jgi:DNA-directed RNA polymerase sigma subunit (sigma70/sigma32)